MSLNIVKYPLSSYRNTKYFNFDVTMITFLTKLGDFITDKDSGYPCSSHRTGRDGSRILDQARRGRHRLRHQLHSWCVLHTYLNHHRTMAIMSA